MNEIPSELKCSRCKHAEITNIVHSLYCAKLGYALVMNPYSLVTRTKRGIVQAFKIREHIDKCNLFEE